jgi:hypothetical protein
MLTHQPLLTNMYPHIHTGTVLYATWCWTSFMCMAYLDALPEKMRRLFSIYITPWGIGVIFFVQLALYLNWLNVINTPFAFFGYITISSSGLMSSALNNLLLNFFQQTLAAFYFRDNFVAIKYRCRPLIEPSEEELKTNIASISTFLSKKKKRKS